MVTRNPAPVILYNSSNEELEIINGEIVTTKTNGEYFCELLADSTGDTNCVLDYRPGETPGPRDFFFKAPDPPSTANYVIARLLVLIEDNGNFAPDTYGSLGAGVVLDPGLQLYKLPSGGSKEYIAPEPITNNITWGLYCFDTKYSAYGNLNETLEVRWSFNRAGTNGITLAPGDEFGIEVQDNLGHLINHKFCIQGNFV